MTDPETRCLLRLEVGRLRARERSGGFEPVLHVGRLGSRAVSSPVPTRDRVMDAGTRAEVVLRLLDNLDAPPESVWVTRSGEPVVQDQDLAWLAASRHAFASVGLRVAGCWCVTRSGWLDVVSGESRTWKRLRL